MATSLAIASCRTATTTGQTKASDTRGTSAKCDALWFRSYPLATIKSAFHQRRPWSLELQPPAASEPPGQAAASSSGPGRGVGESTPTKRHASGAAKPGDVAATPARSIGLSPEIAQRLAQSSRKSILSFDDDLVSAHEASAVELPRADVLLQQHRDHVKGVESQVFSQARTQVQRLYEHVKNDTCNDGASRLPPEQPRQR